MAVERERTGSQRSQRSERTASSDYRYQKPLVVRIKDCCRSTFAFIFSNVGVCGLMVGYTIMGAFLFTAIEGPKEVVKQYTVAVHRNETIEKLWNITVTFNTLYPENWKAQVTQEIINYQNYVVDVVKNGWDGTDGSQGNVMWSIEGGFLYSLTVITTIGYGHISPRTDVGKIVTIFYTIFGMPVFLLYMANMGDILAKSLKWVYAKICICGKSEHQFDASVVWRSADAILRGPASPTFIPAEGDDDDERPTEVEIVRVTGPSRPAKFERRGPSGFSPFGRRYNVTKSTPRERPQRVEPELTYLDTGEEASLGTQSWRSTRSERTDLSSVSIPITISLAIMGALLYGGTKMFQSYEGWDSLTSFYFCFISLTTIGFGDYVPGSSVESITSGNRMSFIYCAIYLMFGLALLSMCFNLMQEEVVHKFTTCVKAITITRRKEQISEPNLESPSDELS